MAQDVATAPKNDVKELRREIAKLNREVARLKEQLEIAEHTDSIGLAKKPLDHQSHC